MESLRETEEIFLEEVEEVEERIIKCDHIFIRIPSDEIQFKCLRGCGCDNTKSFADPESYLFALRLFNNSEIFNEILNENDKISIEEYYNKLSSYIEKKLGKSIELEEDYEIIMKFILEFEKIYFDSLLNEYYSKLFDFNKRLINNPNLNEEEIIGLFHMLSEENILSSEAIVESINSAIPERVASLVHNREEK